MSAVSALTSRTAVSAVDSVEEPADLLYDAAVLGMWAFAHARLRLELLGRTRLQASRGMLLVLTHRAFLDVAVASSLYVPLGLWRSRDTRIHVAGRDDVFARGFLAGFTPSLTPRLRRSLYRVSLASTLERLHVHPIPAASELKLGQLLDELPGSTELASILHPAAIERLRARAAENGLRFPETAAALDNGRYAQILLTIVRREDCHGDLATEIWRRRAGQSVVALRRLVRLAQAGQPLLLFPEGRVSPDGSVGPFERVFSLLLRHGRFESILPIALCYDPLTPRRTRAYISVGTTLEPSDGETATRVLHALRLLTPLTCGQVVASQLLGIAADERSVVCSRLLDQELEAATRLARTEGRPVERSLLSPARRRKRLSECLAALATNGLIVPAHTGADRLGLDTARVLASPVLRRLAREHASAREIEPVAPAIP